MEENQGCCATPFEDLREQALNHYREASAAIHHWNSFVEAAIKAYNPHQTTPPVAPEAAPVKSKEDVRRGNDISRMIEDFYKEEVDVIEIVDRFNKEIDDKLKDYYQEKPFSKVVGRIILFDDAKKTKEQCYEEATLKCLGKDANGTRMDIIYEAMEIYASQFHPVAGLIPVGGEREENIDNSKK